MAHQFRKIIMTIKRTRELLGQKVVHLSDKELLLFINETDMLLDVLISMATSQFPLQPARKNGIT